MLLPRTREEYIHFVEHSYFGAVQAGPTQEVLSCFAPGAVMTGYAGDLPARRLTREADASLDAFMHAAREFDLTYLDFVHVVDTEARRIASYFTLLIHPRPGGTMAHMPARRMRNCNFFHFGNEGLIGVFAYFANPAGETL